MRYRRSRQPGGCYFFTLVTYRRQPLLSLPANIERLRAAFRRERERYPFTIDAIVILPDHLHTLWRLPQDDDDYPNRWSRIKRYFSIGCVGADTTRPASREQKRERAVWQRRFWEHRIRDREDWRGHMDYIHYNPVRHGLSATPAEWPYSSFHRCVEKGWYAADWGGAEPASIVGIDCE